MLYTFIALVENKPGVLKGAAEISARAKPNSDGVPPLIL